MAEGGDELQSILFGKSMFDNEFIISIVIIVANQNPDTDAVLSSTTPTSLISYWTLPMSSTIKTMQSQEQTKSTQYFSLNRMYYKFHSCIHLFLNSASYQQQLTSITSTLRPKQRYRSGRRCGRRNKQLVSDTRTKANVNITAVTKATTTQSSTTISQNETMVSVGNMTMIIGSTMKVVGKKTTALVKTSTITTTPQSRTIVSNLSIVTARPATKPMSTITPSMDKSWLTPMATATPTALTNPQMAISIKKFKTSTAKVVTSTAATVLPDKHQSNATVTTTIETRNATSISNITTKTTTTTISTVKTTLVDVSRVDWIRYMTRKKCSRGKRSNEYR